MSEHAQFDLEIVPVTPSIGAEIGGVDLNVLSEQQFNRVHQALLRWKVLFFRNQRLNHDQLCAFSRRFGDLMALPYIRPVEGYPHVIAVLKEADETDMGVFGGEWHSDFSFLTHPPKLSVLYAKEVPAVGGDTLWANMSEAYRWLPSEKKQWLAKQSAVHTGAPYGVINAPAANEQFTGSIEITRNNPEADQEILHPAVCTHPETGEKTLFVSPTYTTRFGTLSKQGSICELTALFAHCTRPEFVCRYKWAAGTLAVWDNRCTMHYAVNDYDGHRRLLYRTTVQGERPVR